MTASVNISETNSEYQSFKTDFEAAEVKIKLMNDKNASATYNQFLDYIDDITDKLVNEYGFEMVD